MSQLPPPTGDRQFRDQIVRIAEHTVNTVLLDGMTFQNCRIIGPAVLVLLGDTHIAHCGFDAPDTEAIFWEIPPHRELVVGAVGVANCTFSSCTFVQIGLAGPPELRQMIERAFSG